MVKLEDILNLIEDHTLITVIDETILDTLDDVDNAEEAGGAWTGRKQDFMNNPMYVPGMYVNNIDNDFPEDLGIRIWVR